MQPAGVQSLEQFSKINYYMQLVTGVQNRVGNQVWY